MEKLWKYKKIGEVCIVERGASPRPIDKYITDNESGINWIKIGDTSDSMYITETAQKIIVEGMKKSRYVKPGDFLLSNSMSFGRPYILKIDGCIHDGWLVLRDENALFDKRFLYYYLSSKTTYKKLKSMAVGGVVNNLNSEMVRNVIVPVPDKEEQSEIADLFDKIKKILDDRKQELEQLDTLVKSRFVEMFGDIITGKYNYKIRKLGDVAFIGSSHRVFTTEFVESGIPFYRGTEIGELANGIEPSEPYYISEEHYNKLTTVGSYGHPAVVKKEKPFCFQRHIAYLKPNADMVDSEYLRGAILSADVQRQIDEGVKGIAQKTLNLSEIRKIKLPLPPIDRQKQFAAFVAQTDKSK